MRFLQTAEHGSSLPGGAPVFGFISLLLVSACSGQSQSGPPPAPSVTVAPPIVQNLIEWDEYTGRFEAIDYVEVRARVSGYLESVHFNDGDVVEKGDLLFVIDKRPFEAALAEAKGRAGEAAAALELARNDRKRAERLLASKAVSQEEFDLRLQNERGATASLEAANASVRAAELELEFAEVRAPITGRISDDRVGVGNLIGGGAANAIVGPHPRIG